jgi:broad specificity phosphatase PhoE
MARVLIITHPEVEPDPETAVPRWALAPVGVNRMRAFAASAELAHVTSIWASDERKAIEAAGVLGGGLQLGVKIEPDLHENDRSATGYLPPGEFEAVADAFFSQPTESVRGWERAIDAQARMATAVQRITDAARAGDIAIVAHGGVGSLLLCRHLGESISRAHDQPHQGCWWSFDRNTGEVLTRWRAIARP